MATKARLLANKKYNTENYDEIKLRVHKGSKEQIQTHAEQRGESLNGFITRAIRETIERDQLHADG